MKSWFPGLPSGENKQAETCRERGSGGGHPRNVLAQGFLRPLHDDGWHGLPSRHTHKSSSGASALEAPCVLNGSSHFDRPQPKKKSKYHGFSPKQNRPQRPLTAGGQPGLQMSPNLGDQVSQELSLRGANSELCGTHRAGVTQFPRASVGGGRARKTQLQPHTSHPPTPMQ